MKAKIINHYFFNKINTEEKAYWLGFLRADGCILESKKICLRLAIKDEESVKQFKEAVNCNNKLLYYEGRESFNGYMSKPQVMMKFTSEEMAKDLAKHGVVPIKSKLQQGMPEIEDNLKPHFIRGFFDGDGCVSTGPIFTITNSDLKLLQDIQSFMVYELDLGNNSIYSNRNSYVLAWGGSHQFLKIYKWLYENANIFMERKHKKFTELQNNNRPKESTKEEIQFIYKLKDEGNTVEEISEITGKSKAVVYYWLRKIK